MCLAKRVRRFCVSVAGAALPLRPWLGDTLVVVGCVPALACYVRHWLRPKTGEGEEPQPPEPAEDPAEESQK